MAAGWARALGGDAVLIFSGGSSPAEVVNPVAVEAMAEVGVDISGAAPKRWTEEVVAKVDVEGMEDAAVSGAAALFPPSSPATSAAVASPAPPSTAASASVAGL